jgi:glutamyl-tRNA synthetase
VASFDVKKLVAFQERYAQRLTLDEKVAWVTPFLDRAGLKADDATLRRVIVLAAHRLVVAGDILDYAYFFAADDAVEMDLKAVEKHITKQPLARQWLTTMGEQLAALPTFDAPTIEAAVRQYVELHSQKLNDVAQALRVATTGRAAGFGSFETLALLGRDRTVARINRVAATLP